MRRWGPCCELCGRHRRPGVLLTTKQRRRRVRGCGGGAQRSGDAVQRVHSSFSTPRISSSRNSMNLTRGRKASRQLPRRALAAAQRGSCRRGNALGVVQLHRLPAVLGQKHAVALGNACTRGAAVARRGVASAVAPPGGLARSCGMQRTRGASPSARVAQRRAQRAARARQAARKGRGDSRRCCDAPTGSNAPSLSRLPGPTAMTRPSFTCKPPSSVRA